MSHDDETRWGRQLLVALGALVAFSLIVGAVIATVALVAAKVSGFADAGGPSARPSLYMPPLSRVGDQPAPVGPNVTPRPSPSASPSGSPSASASPSRKPSGKPRPITLKASPLSVRPNERIYLTGAYRHDGAGLRVQRREAGRWSDFPTTATVHGGAFATYIYTGRTGVNLLRMQDPASGKVSNTVRIRVG